MIPSTQSTRKNPQIQDLITRRQARISWTAQSTRPLCSLITSSWTRFTLERVHYYTTQMGCVSSINTRPSTAASHMRVGQPSMQRGGGPEPRLYRVPKLPLAPAELACIHSIAHSASSRDENLTIYQSDHIQHSFLPSFGSRRTVDAPCLRDQLWTRDQRTRGRYPIRENISIAIYGCNFAPRYACPGVLKRQVEIQSSTNLRHKTALGHSKGHPKEEGKALQVDLMLSLE